MVLSIRTLHRNNLFLSIYFEFNIYSRIYKQNAIELNFTENNKNKNKLNTNTQTEKFKLRILLIILP